MIKKFRLHPDQITAIQWDGKNTKEVCDFCGAMCITQVAYGDFIDIPGNCGVLDITPLDWVVKLPNGNYTVWSDHKIRKYYDEVME